LEFEGNVGVNGSVRNGWDCVECVC